MISSADYPDALNRLPLSTFESLVGDRAVLVIAPHPDDESLGCGGLLAWAAARGRRTEILFLTNGEASHPGSVAIPALQLAQIRAREALDAAAQLGVPASSVDFLRLSDGSLLSMTKGAFATVAEELRVVIRKLVPCLVCVTAATDPHGDHQQAFELAAAAVFGLQDCCLYTYPVWSWVLPPGQHVREPRGYRVDINSAREQKSRAIASHVSQHGRVVSDSPHAFVLPKLLLERLDQGFEVYLES